MSTDRDYMERALALAELAKGRTSPNPMVGCVVVNDGKIKSHIFLSFQLV